MQHQPGAPSTLGQRFLRHPLPIHPGAVAKEHVDAPFVRATREHVGVAIPIDITHGDVFHALEHEVVVVGIGQILGPNGFRALVPPTFGVAKPGVEAFAVAAVNQVVAAITVQIQHF